MTERDFEKEFEEEEKLRLEIERLGRIHDCKEAGCTVDMHETPIDKDNTGEVRPELDQEHKDLWNKYRSTKL